MITYTTYLKTYDNKIYIEGSCDPDDEMPTENIAQGSILLVLDSSGNLTPYGFHEATETWVPIAGAGRRN